MTTIEWISDSELFDFGFAAATESIARTLESGFDPATDKVRSFVDFSRGQGLVMPSEIGDYVGLKFVTVAPENPKRELDRIQGVFTLFDAETLSPLAQCNGAALTLLRTASVTTAVLTKLKLKANPKVAVFGSGPQALAHISSIHAAFGPESVLIYSRNSATASKLVESVNEMGIDCRRGGQSDLAEADLVITATTSRDPLFNLSQLNPNVVIAAVGSHEPDVRELGSDVVGAAQIFVEDVTTSLREAGEVVSAIQDGTISRESLIPISNLFGFNSIQADNQVLASGIRLYKSTGMPWQDLAIFGAFYESKDSNI